MLDLNQVTMRFASRQDLPALEWNGEFSHFRRLYQDIYQSAVRGEALLWVAELLPQGVIGQVFVQLRSGRLELADGVIRAYIYGFRVKKPYRGQGLGAYMLAVIEADLLKRGFRQAVLNVNQDNPDARRLYERYGYQVVAPEAGRWSYIDDRGLKRNVNEPAWRMQKDLLLPVSVKNT
jgi:ribosomal protein S18 acetylase RimI-like enzyme